ncbi:MAG: type II toxin-antitoxin system HicB family antitoxin [Planctomycetes bacterium]|nr:type II toxin-antitoxin system HicB family antitoxin [Planctomycetota bacterium]
MQMLSHRGFDGTVSFEEEFGFYSGRVIGVVGVVAFRGDTLEEARQDFVQAVNDYLETAATKELKPAAEDGSKT